MPFNPPSRGLRLSPRERPSSSRASGDGNTLSMNGQSVRKDVHMHMFCRSDRVTLLHEGTRADPAILPIQDQSSVTRHRDVPSYIIL